MKYNSIIDYSEAFLKLFENQIKEEIKSTEKFNEFKNISKELHELGVGFTQFTNVKISETITEVINEYGVNDKILLNEVLLHVNSHKYLKSILRYLIFLLAWIKLKNNDELYKKGDLLLKTSIIGTIAFRIKDLIYDEQKALNLGILTEVFAFEYEKRLFDIYGHSENVYSLYYQTQKKFWKAEFKEKHKMMQKKFCYTTPKESGVKAMLLFTPVILTLNQNSESSLISEYESMFYGYTSAMQILDDIEDFNDDITNNHYSLPAKLLGKAIIQKAEKDTYFKILIDNKDVMRKLYVISIDLLNDSSKKAIKLDDSIFQFIIEFLRAKIHYVFLKRFKIK